MWLKICRQILIVVSRLHSNVEIRLDRVMNLFLGRQVLAVVESRVAPIKYILCTGVCIDVLRLTEAQKLE